MATIAYLYLPCTWLFPTQVDGISDDSKMESQRDIHQRTSDDLSEAGLNQIHLSFHLTSIYDHSIFEAFSKVVQKLIPQLPTLENLLNIFIPVSFLVIPDVELEITFLFLAELWYREGFSV